MVVEHDHKHTAVTISSLRFSFSRSDVFYRFCPFRICKTSVSLDGSLPGRAPPHVGQTPLTLALNKLDQFHPKIRLSRPTSTYQSGN